jgi:hypothetical protein
MLKHTLERLIEHMLHPPDGYNRTGQWGLKRGQTQTFGSRRARFVLSVAILLQVHDGRALRGRCHPWDGFCYFQIWRMAVGDGAKLLRLKQLKR